MKTKKRAVLKPSKLLLDINCLKEYIVYMTDINELSIAKSINDDLTKTQISMLHMLHLMFASANKQRKVDCLVASNKDLANIFDRVEETVSRNIAVLERKGYIRLEYDNNGYGVERKIYLK